ncbi:MAG: hypothetical protein ACUVYA_11925 [Planctomycetota bacterium]
MRTLTVIVLSAAFAAGLIAGYVEHRAETSAKPPAGTEQGGTARVLEPLSAGSERPPAAAPEEAPGAASETEEGVRRAARARLLERLFRSLPPPQPLQGFSEIFLSSGVRVRARQVKKEGDRYVLELVQGVTWKPRADEVLEVRALDPQAHVASEKAKIDAKLRGLAHPVDLYLDGARRYRELGLDDDARRTLERILAAPPAQALEALLLFVPDADEALREDFEVAAGIREPSPPESPPAAAPPREPPRAEPTKRAETSELSRAQDLVDRASALYRAGALREGKEDELAEARKLLDEAREILENRPDDERAQALRRRIGQLMSDVSRASPF